MDSAQPTSPTTMAEWRLRNARVVGVLKKGGAIVEMGIDLDIREGRCMQTWGDMDDPDRKVRLDYDFTFEAAGEEPPQCMQSLWGSIVITGEDEEGDTVIIQGNGWIGYDEYGRPQGSFLKPPRIKVVGEDRATSLKRSVAEQWEDCPTNPKNLGMIQ